MEKSSVGLRGEGVYHSSHLLLAVICDSQSVFGCVFC